MHSADLQHIGSSNLEFAFSLAVVLMHSWKNQLGSGMTPMHDATAAMSRQRNSWDALMSTDAPTDVIGYDRGLMTFPIGIKETFFESSEKFVGLQLADVLAGIVTECLTSN